MSTENEYAPWVETGETELAYYKRQFLEAVGQVGALQFELERQRQEAADIIAERNRLDEAYDELAARTKRIVQNLNRNTNLIRKALAPEDQIGYGLYGMVQSLLAMAASVPAYRERLKALEEDLRGMAEDWRRYIRADDPARRYVALELDHRASAVLGDDDD